MNEVDRGFLIFTISYIVGVFVTVTLTSFSYYRDKGSFRLNRREYEEFSFFMFCCAIWPVIAIGLIAYGLICIPTGIGYLLSRLFRVNKEN